ncbi:MAG: ABC transporter permease [Ruminococcaceae bacterium]|jgi:spermidine/putrescine transport system permease protein|nr:ABC transporter permease [Oscillospiraceae bacterium]
MKQSSFLKKIINAPYMLWSVLFTVAPLIMVIYYAFTNADGAFSLDNIKQIGDYASTFILSMGYGAVATVICLLLAYPFAYFLAHCGVSFKRMSVMLVMLPMWMSFLIRTYSWMTILGDSGVVNNFLFLLGKKEPLPLLNTPGAVILGMVYNFLPYMILPLYTVMDKMDNSLVEAAQDLGSSKLNTLRRVILPLSVPGIASGVTMVFVPSVSTFYITQKLGGGQINLIGDVIEGQFQTAYNYNLGAALSLVLMVLILICLGVLNYFTDSEDNGGVLI